MVRTGRGYTLHVYRAGPLSPAQIAEAREVIHARVIVDRQVLAGNLAVGAAIRLYGQLNERMARVIAG